MNPFRDAVVVVTGAASGIGRATALTFSRLEARLVLADLQEDLLAGVADEISSKGGLAQVFRLDVADPDGVGSFAREVLRRSGPVDVVVNSAGVLVLGETRLVTLEDFRWIMGVNFWGAVHLIQAFLPSMIERRRGHFVNISSANALAPVPYVGPYTASKAALTMISEVLRAETARFGIGVTTVFPGFTRTALRSRAILLADSEAGAAFLQRVREKVKRGEADPFEVARRIPPAVRRNRAFIRMSRETFLLSWAYRFFPGIVRRVGRYALKRTA